MDIQTAFKSLAVTAMDHRGMTAEQAARYALNVLATERPELLTKLALSMGIM